MFLWGANFAFVKYLLDPLGVGPFLFIRFVTMPLLAFLLLLLVFKKHVARTWPKREDLPPPIAGVVAWLTLGEQFTWLKIAGACITMAGVAWAQFGGGRPPPREAAQVDSG